MDIQTNLLGRGALVRFNRTELSAYEKIYQGANTEVVAVLDDTRNGLTLILCVSKAHSQAGELIRVNHRDIQLVN